MLTATAALVNNIHVLDEQQSNHTLNVKRRQCRIGCFDYAFSYLLETSAAVKVFETREPRRACGEHYMSLSIRRLSVSALIHIQSKRLLDYSAPLRTM
jgi:hypothetical protein